MTASAKSASPETALPKAASAKTAIVSTRIDGAIVETLDRIAHARKRSRAFVVRELLEDAVRREAEFHDFIAAGRIDIAAGRTVSHDELTKHLHAKWADGAAP